MLGFGHIFIQKFEILLRWDWKVGYYGKGTEIVMAMSSLSLLSPAGVLVGHFKSSVLKEHVDCC